VALLKRGRIQMDSVSKMNDKSTWAIGGGTLLGVGVGMFFLRESPLIFVGCVLAGIGLGLIITSLASR
jgi:hypothetical protein